MTLAIFSTWGRLWKKDCVYIHQWLERLASPLNLKNWVDTKSPQEHQLGSAGLHYTEVRRYGMNHTILIQIGFLQMLRVQAMVCDLLISRFLLVHVPALDKHLPSLRLECWWQGCYRSLSWHCCQGKMRFNMKPGWPWGLKVEFCALWREGVKIISQNEQKQKGANWREKVKLWMDSPSWSEEEEDKLLQNYVCGWGSFRKEEWSKKQIEHIFNYLLTCILWIYMYAKNRNDTGDVEL